MRVIYWEFKGGLAPFGGKREAHRDKAKTNRHIPSVE